MSPREACCSSLSTPINLELEHRVKSDEELYLSIRVKSWFWYELLQVDNVFTFDIFHKPRCWSNDHVFIARKCCSGKQCDSSVSCYWLKNTSYEYYEGFSIKHAWKNYVCTTSISLGLIFSVQKFQIISYSAKDSYDSSKIWECHFYSYDSQDLWWVSRHKGERPMLISNTVDINVKNVLSVQNCCLWLLIQVNAVIDY